ncbi:MAG: T9SS type A sorting domain-containing protein [Flavobacteriia bacterium]|nr:T9SS type A sorting domain-containing protein [Flavobacteriia bacterium]
MKTIVTTTFILFTFALFSQVWVNSNPVWHYNYWTISEGGFIKIEQTGDTLIEGFSCQKLNGIKHAFFVTGPDGNIGHTASVFGNWYTRASNDTVYYWDENHFNVLYDFSASVGDSWLIEDGTEWFQCNDSSYTKVESVGTVNLNGEQAIQLNLIDSVGGSFGLSGAVNSHFGAMGGFLFPTGRSCDSTIIVEWYQFDFCSFQDDSLSYNPSGEDCEYMLTHLGLAESNTFRYLVAPNPANDILHVLLPKGKAHYRIITLTGKEMETGTLTEQTFDLNISHLSEGMYMLQLTGQNGEINSLRFCVSR